jgi:hypothetical protein
MALFLYPGRVSFSAPTLSNPLPQGEVGAQRRVRILIQRVLARLWNSAVLLFQMMSEIEKSIEIAQLNGFVFSPSSDRSLLSESRPTASSCGVRLNASAVRLWTKNPFVCWIKWVCFSHLILILSRSPTMAGWRFLGRRVANSRTNIGLTAIPRIKNALSFLHLMGLFLHFRIILDAPKTPAAPIRTPRDSA